MASTWSNERRLKTQSKKITHLGQDRPLLRIPETEALFPRVGNQSICKTSKNFEDIGCFYKIIS